MHISELTRLQIKFRYLERHLFSGSALDLKAVVCFACPEDQALLRRRVLPLCTGCAGYFEVEVGKERENDVLNILYGGYEMGR